MNNYAQPDAGGDQIPFKDQGNLLDGSLLLINVLEALPPVPNRFSRADKRDPEPVKAVVAVLDGQLQGEVYWDTLIFPLKLSAVLRGKVGEIVLGRLGKGQAKHGQNPPWTLNPYTAADTQLADAFRQANPDFDAATARPRGQEDPAHYQPSGNGQPGWGSAPAQPAADPWGQSPRPAAPAKPLQVQHMENAGASPELAAAIHAAGGHLQHLKAIQTAYPDKWNTAPASAAGWFVSRGQELISAQPENEPPF